MPALKKFLKSGFLPFFAGVAVIASYFWLSNYKVGGDIYGEISIFNILFTLLFITACCIAAYFYGRRKNKNGFIGLLCVFAPYFISLIMLVPNAAGIFPSVIVLPLFLIFFSYVTLFLAPNIAVAVWLPAVLILLMIILWRIGTRKSKGGDAHAG